MNIEAGDMYVASLVINGRGWHVDVKDSRGKTVDMFRGDLAGGLADGIDRVELLTTASTALSRDWLPAESAESADTYRWDAGWHCPVRRADW